MKILIKNCDLISMDEKREKIENEIDILIEENKVKKIAKNIQEEVDKVIEGTGKVVMPGLINTHSHIAMSIFRETVDGYKTQEWLKQKIWPLEDKLTEKDVYYASMLSCLEMIKTGTTTVNDMYFMQDETIKAVLNSGIRIQLTRTLTDVDGRGETKIAEFEEMMKKYQNKYENITLNLGIHGLYTSSEEYIEKCIKLAEKYDLPIHIHFCENIEEVEDIKKLQNVENPVDSLEKHFKNKHVILAHAVKLTYEEIERLSKMNIYIAHCPVSNLKLGCGVANIVKMQEEGICVALGSDGQGSGSNLDMFEEMKFAALLQKGILENPVVMPAYEVLKMATINGAKALGMEEKIGSIQEGKLADLIILDMSECITCPHNDIFAQIVYNVKGSNVETTIVNGKILMEKRNVIGFDEKEICNKCERIKNNL